MGASQSTNVRLFAKFGALGMYISGGLMQLSMFGGVMSKTVMLNVHFALLRNVSTAM